jgi:hypothetical protein
VRLNGVKDTHDETDYAENLRRGLKHGHLGYAPVVVVGLTNAN